METNLAVLIDFENIAAGTEKEGLGRFDVDAVLKRVKDKGRVLVARSYADWGRFARFKQSLLLANVNMYELTSHGMQDKNRADIAMVVDALDLAFTKDYIETFVIVSGDSDFTPLALKMRELNKRVIGIGTRGSTSRLLIQACDEFIFYNTIVEGKRKKERRERPNRPARAGARGSNKLEDGFDLLTDALEGLLRESSDLPLASVVKTAMKRKQPDFSEGDLGFNSFGKFLQAARDANHVTLERDTKAGGFRVEPVESGDEPSEPAPRRRAETTWSDPYLPKGVEPWVALLSNDRIDPLSAPVRKTVLEAFETIVKERDSRNRRVTVQFVQEDVRKRMQKTHPDLPAKSIKSVFNALMRGNVLIHKDGTPIRTVSAPFNLEKDADQLNIMLVNVYMQALFDQGADMGNAKLLSELFLGDRDRSREIEEIQAWLQATDVDGSLDGLLEIDDDDLLEVDDDSSTPEPPKAKAKAKGDKPKGKSDARSKAPPAPTEDDFDLDAALLIGDDDDDDTSDDDTSDDDTSDSDDAIKAEEPKAPAKKKTAAKKTTAKKKTAAKKTTAKKKTAKKKAAPKAEAAPAAEKKDDDDDTDAAPKKKTTRKRKRKKTASEDAPADES